MQARRKSIAAKLNGRAGSKTIQPRSFALWAAGGDGVPESPDS
jgi:hypothetical protein